MFRHPTIPSLPALVTATLVASAALAAPTLPGINIRWDNCYADGGAMNKAFACDTNTGSELAVLSVQLDTGMLDVSGMEVRISLKASTSTWKSPPSFFTCSMSPTRTSREAFACCPLAVILPRSQDREASDLVLKKRAAQSHLSILTYSTLQLTPDGLVFDLLVVYKQEGFTQDQSQSSVAFERQGNLCRGIARALYYAQIAAARLE